MKSIVRGADVESLFQDAWNFLPFVLLILYTRNYSDTLVCDCAYANGSCLLTCHFKSSVCSIENHFPWGTIFCWGLLGGFGFVFFKVNFATTKKELSRIKLPVYCASSIVNQFQLNDCKVPLKWLSIVWSSLLLIASRGTNGMRRLFCAFQNVFLTTFNSSACRKRIFFWRL